MWLGQLLEPGPQHGYGRAMPGSINRPGKCGQVQQESGCAGQVQPLTHVRMPSRNLSWVWQPWASSIGLDLESSVFKSILTYLIDSRGTHYGKQGLCSEIRAIKHFVLIFAFSRGKFYPCKEVAPLHEEYQYNPNPTQFWADLIWYWTKRHKKKTPEVTTALFFHQKYFQIK